MTTHAENRLLEAIFGRGQADTTRPPSIPEEEKLKLRIKVHGGTPQDHQRSLCSTCAYSLILQGAAVSERKVLCSELKNGYGQEEVPFEIVTECSAYSDKTKPSLHEMQKIAFILKTDPRGKPIGFVPNRQFRVEEKAGDEPIDIIPGHDM
jgi:hypothetical protein